MEIFCSFFVKCIAKLISHPLTYELVKNYSHGKIVQSVGTSISTLFGDASKFIGYANAFMWFESPINIGGFIMDIVQTFFECCGLPNSGKLLGFSVTVISGAVGGAKVSGVIPGAILGAIISGAVWTILELARCICSCMCECDQNEQ